MKYLLDSRDVFGRWVVDDSKSVLQGDNQAFPVQNNNKKKEKSSDLIFLPEARETILELFTVRIFVGCSQNASPGSFFSPFFVCLNFCRYSAVL